MINQFRKILSDNYGVLIRIDDVAENMNWEMFDKVKGLPWEPIPPELQMPRIRDVYITRDRILKYEPTPGCPAGAGAGGVHTPACRERFRKLVDEDRAEQEVARAAAEPAPPVGKKAP